MTASEAPTGAGTDTEASPKTITYVKQHGGRPRKGEERPKIPPLPRPASFKGIKVQQFLEYWRKTDQKFPARLVVYIYRSWPVTDRTRCGLDKYIDVLAVGSTIVPDDIADADQFETFMLHRFGEGDYKLILNDGAISREVCQVFAKYRDSTHLSIVEPLASLVVEDPINRPFIEALTRKGVKIPGTYQQNEEEDEMARVTTGLTETVDRLVDKNMEMAQQVLEATQRPETEAEGRRREPHSSDALEASMKIVTEATKMGTQIIDSAVKKVGEIQAAATAKESSPVETMTGLVALAKTMVPAPAAEGGMLGTLLTAMMEQAASDRAAATAATAAQNQLLRDLVFGAHNPSPTLPGGSPGLAPGMGTGSGVGMGAAPAAAQPKTLADQIREFKDIQDLLTGGGGDDETGAGGAGGGGKQSIWERLLPFAMQALTLTSGNIANVIYNLAVAKSGQGQPIPAAQLQPGAGDQGDRDQLPTPPPTDQSQTQPGVYTSDPILAAYHRSLAEIRDPLLQAINNGETGYEFAEKLANWKGDMAYKFLRELGADKLNQLLSTYPPIWEYVSKIPAGWTQFLDDFLAFGEPELDEPPAPVPVAVTRAAAPVRHARATKPAPAAATGTSPMDQDPLAGKGLPKTVVS